MIGVTIQKEMDVYKFSQSMSNVARARSITTLEQFGIAGGVGTRDTMPHNTWHPDHTGGVVDLPFSPALDNNSSSTKVRLLNLRGFDTAFVQRTLLETSTKMGPLHCETVSTRQQQPLSNQILINNQCVPRLSKREPAYALQDGVP